MVDWTASMQQTFEYYTVDPGTWKDNERVTNVKSSTISRDSSVETLGSATFDVTDSLGECYMRVYLVTIQNGETNRHPLGTFLVQTPSSSFDGKIRSVSMDAYTPLLELKESQPPLGYYIAKKESVMNWVNRLTREHLRAPVVDATCEKTLYDDFVANTDDTWLTFITDLAANADYTFDLDELGRVLFSPNQEIASSQPVWTYSDDNSSILYPDFSMDHDLYGLPNVVEIVYSGSSDDDFGPYYTKATNDDSNSPISTVNRGREIVNRVTDPTLTLTGTSEQKKQQVDEYAEKLLKELSAVEYTVSYTHGYCPVRVGDCVRLNYTRAGITDVKAKVISQSIKCDTGCSVSEKAVFTVKLWE